MENQRVHADNEREGLRTQLNMDLVVHKDFFLGAAHDEIGADADGDHDDYSDYSDDHSSHR